MWLATYHLRDNSMETENYLKYLSNKSGNGKSLLVCSRFLKTLMKIWWNLKQLWNPSECFLLFESFTNKLTFIFIKRKKGISLQSTLIIFLWSEVFNKLFHRMVIFFLFQLRMLCIELLFEFQINSTTQ